MSDELEKARALLVEENKRRVEACWADLHKVLDEHECDINGVPVFVPAGDAHVIRVQIWVSARED